MFDFDARKVKAKQFVKIYGQTAAILPFENLEWETLFWFLKFLAPKLKVAEAEAAMSPKRVGVIRRVLPTMQLSNPHGREVWAPQ